MSDDEAERWLPLESNPESFNAWSHSLGLDTSKYSFQEVYGLDPELLSWVKQPVKAVLMLFPPTKSYAEMRDDEDEEIAENGVEGVEDVLYFKQTIANACGTFALIHALANAEDLELEQGPLTTLFKLDGGRESPVNRGRIGEEGLLGKAVEQVRKVVELTGSIEFNLVTLSPTEEEEEEGGEEEEWESESEEEEEDK
ncbi:ubiquitin carboxyl-terminal hydrolase L3 [Pseudohyphozyma bogoriensis]|nr:ubiquitin carboxyl-terminal hydrolase L3 [Pseudohyphozyma bogoriensis]